jgi:histidinol-phosphate/aromatic aminotransferase/cobyric acid decarboxylase-like protein
VVDLFRHQSVEEGTDSRRRGRRVDCDRRAGGPAWDEAGFATLAPPQLAIQRERVGQVRAERERLRVALTARSSVLRLWPGVANFLLTDFRDAEVALAAARGAKLLIRDMRSVSPHSLRISVGTPEQNDRLIRSLA